MNCETPLFGKFCLECGQRDTDLRRPLWTFLLEFVDDVFSLDSRLLRSLGPLVFKPGALSRRYVDGGRVSVLPPIRMLLVILVLFFLTLELGDVALVQLKVEPKTEEEITQQEQINQEIRARVEEVAAQGGVSADMLQQSGVSPQPAGAESMSPSGAAQAVDSAEGSEQIAEPPKLLTNEDFSIDLLFFQHVRSNSQGPLVDDQAWADYLEAQTEVADEAGQEIVSFSTRVLHGINVMVQDARLMNRVFNQWLPRALVVLVPVLALFLWLFYWGINSYYFNHLIFSLHLHAFMFLMLTGLSIVLPRYDSDVGAAVFFFGMPLYTLIAMKVMYRQGIFRTLVKFGFVVGTYAVLLLLALFSIIVWGLSTAP
jgi:hypothetical protein